MEMSDFMKAHWAKLRLGDIEQTEMKNRKQSLMIEKRKIKRETETLTRRNIPIEMSPYVTPRPHKSPVKITKIDSSINKADSRREALLRWKAEKEKRREQEKAKQKPVFKVCHIATSLKVELEDVNKVIKGKLIPSKKMVGVPKKYKFEPPKGVKPIPNFITGQKAAFKVTRESSSVKSKLSNSVKVTTQPTRQKQQDSQKVGGAQSNHYNLRTQKVPASKSTKPPAPAKTRVKAVTPKKTSPKKILKTPQNQRILTSPRDTKQLNDVSPRLLGSLVKPKLLTKQDRTPTDRVQTAIISPFVTLSRGKKNARDEYKVKHANCENEVKNIDPDIVTKVRKSTTLNDGPDYFMHLLDSEIERISRICEKWDKFVQDNEVPEEATSSIDVAVGQARLLMSKKFNQFRGLIVQCQTEQYEEKHITCEDLHGFWDMIYMQVEDLNKRFSNLDRLKDSNWEEMMPEKKQQSDKVQNKRKVKSKKPAASSRLKDMIKAARAKQKQGEGNDDEIVVSGGQSQSPKEQCEQPVQTPQKRTSRIFAVKSETKSRFSPSPSGLMMMKVTQSIKRGNGLTPAKSILKIDGAKSTGKKSVVFRESMQDNITEMSTDLTKVNTPKARRSIRFDNSESKENCPVRRSERLKSVR